jgi:hypothetical protein
MTVVTEPSTRGGGQRTPAAPRPAQLQRINIAGAKRLHEPSVCNRAGRSRSRRPHPPATPAAVAYSPLTPRYYFSLFTEYLEA